MAHKYKISEVFLTEKQKQACTRLIHKFALESMPFMKKEDGNYELYCPCCNTYLTLTPKQFKNTRSQKECPSCFNKWRGTTHTSHYKKIDYINIGHKGYEIVVEWEYGKDPVCVSATMMADFSSIDSFIRDGWELVNFGHTIKHKSEVELTDNYHKSSSQYWSYNFTYPIREDHAEYLSEIEDGFTRRQYLEKKLKFIEKSNQKKLIADNYLSTLQAKFIKVFDLKTLEEVEKYSRYMKENKEHIEEYMAEKICLNSYYLDYLCRNKIDLGKYYGFLHELKALGFKYEKPTSFTHRESVVHEMYVANLGEITEKQIVARSKELPHYQKDNVSISPFKSSDEIRHCGKTLHNCIGGFVNRYANKMTDIYHLDLDGAIKVAIEIRDLTLIQAREDHNHECPKNLLEHIAKFCEANNYSLGRYEFQLD